ncbi:MAG: hypothetical protein ACK56O_07925, partial [Dolichospermum sp.]
HKIVHLSHSLGTLIEWKLPVTGEDIIGILMEVPHHSLGTLIEWKRFIRSCDRILRVNDVPTRWGH